MRAICQGSLTTSRICLDDVVRHAVESLRGDEREEHDPEERVAPAVADHQEGEEVEDEGEQQARRHCLDGQVW